MKLHQTAVATAEVGWRRAIPFLEVMDLTQAPTCLVGVDTIACGVDTQMMFVWQCHQSTRDCRTDIDNFCDEGFAEER